MTRDTGKRAAAPRRTTAAKKPAPTPPTVAAALAALKGASTRKDYANLARFGIAAPQAFGVSIANMQSWPGAIGATTSLPPRSGTPDVRSPDAHAFVDDRRA